MDRTTRAVGGTRHGLPCIIVVALVALACAGGDRRAPRTEPLPRGPNVLLISIDTLRADHVGAYGYERDTTPVIDRLATEGVVFENQISSSSWTLPAHAALLTSLPDSVHGATDTDRRIADGIETLAERFYGAGYTTVGFFAGPYLHPAFGFGQGFEQYLDCTSYASRLDDEPVEAWAMDEEIMERSHQDITNPRVLEAFRGWLEQPRERKFFAFVHLWDAHFDFIPPPPYDTRFDPDYQGDVTGENFFFDASINADMPARDLQHLIALYDGEIAWTDEHVGHILEALSQAGELDDTVVAITSDHGTEFFEHGNKGHRTTLFDELIRVPLVLWYPPALQPARVSAQTRGVDVGPTLLELAGLPPPTDVFGHSLVGLAHGGEPDFDNRAVSELFSVGQRVRTLRTRDWKLYDVMSLGRRLWTDLRADPAERLLRPVGDGPGKALEAQYLEVATALAVAREKLQPGDDRSTMPDEVRRQLESLGYISR